MEKPADMTVVQMTASNTFHKAGKAAEGKEWTEVGQSQGKEL